MLVYIPGSPRLRASVCAVNSDSAKLTRRLPCLDYSIHCPPDNNQRTARRRQVRLDWRCIHTLFDSVSALVRRVCRHIWPETVYDRFTVPVRDWQRGVWRRPQHGHAHCGSKSVFSLSSLRSCLLTLPYQLSKASVPRALVLLPTSLSLISCLSRTVEPSWASCLLFGQSLLRSGHLSAVSFPRN